MLLSLVVAASENDVIGDHGAIPWHLPDDLKFFRELTKGRPVIMGRKTYESIGHALPGRTNIIITRRDDYAAPDCIVTSSIADAILQAEATGADEAFIIGGGEIYKEALSRAHRVHLTRVHAHVDGDATFPALDRAAWRETKRTDHPADDRHAHAFSFLTYERIS